MDKYVVCMRSGNIRDAQFMDTTELSDDVLNGEEFDSYDEEYCELWCDMSPEAFIGIFEAENESDACQKASDDSGYDVRSLYAIKV